MSKKIKYSIVEKRWEKATPEDKKKAVELMTKGRKKYWYKIPKEHRILKMKCVRQGLSWADCKKKYKI